MLVAAEPEVASRVRRLVACLIDLALCAALTVTVDAAADSLDADELLAALTGFLYFWLLHARYGRTLGKRLTGIKVLSLATGRPPTLQDAAYRAGFYVVMPLMPSIGWIIAAQDGLQIFRDAGNRCLHDRLAGTVVVRES
ncbi:RDD family protein [Nonomuraea sp. NN258]|uniref:RDD family protein n=1 Tax=Nonomuraea antri TaxID=2730852 RepID=UPI0015697C10|nr:RDD family protein [Nonomuraea antri]NRQ35114.1 RDD family protein [Nonomuraea antri]